MQSTGRVLLFKGRGLLSAFIRWHTRSVYSHAAIQLMDGTIIEAWQFAGVRAKVVKDWRHIEAYEIAGSTPSQWRDIACFLRDQLGKRYDYGGVVGFLLRYRHDLNRQRWFCSELVYAAAISAGLALLARTKPVYVSPGLLALSPMLVRSTPLPRSSS